jgi:tRNA A37 threonylcarbamoyladenosine biosynthesis protein TsaE
LEAINIGLEEYLESDGITAIEWAERAEELIPPDAIRLRFTTGDQPDLRKVVVASQ